MRVKSKRLYSTSQRTRTREQQRALKQLPNPGSRKDRKRKGRA